MFQGSSLDIYIHWLILALGIGIFVSGIAVLTTCRSVAGFFHLLRDNIALKSRIYAVYFRFHSYYWVAFLMFLVLHLIVTIVHVGLPSSEEPYFLLHQFVFSSSIINFLLALLVFSSCKSFLSLFRLFTFRNPLSSSRFNRFYKFHPILWVILVISFTVHITFGIIHAINT
jgi:hypothetical protein